MVERVQELVIRPEERGRFELVFGPGGAWGSLFGQHPGFRGTTLLRDVQDPRRYLVIDLWEAEGQREQALAAQEAAWSGLEAALAGWAESRQELGTFRVLAEGTVRPHGRAGRSAAGEAHRRGRRATR